jgi:hypothetical protein
LRDRACGRARRVSRFLQKNRKIQEKTAMRFQQGQSGNPSGRPRGALNRATVLAQELLSARVEGIAGKLIELRRAATCGPFACAWSGLCR